MEELTPEELEDVLKAPQPKKRKAKSVERSYHAWFYDIKTHLGSCDNPDCNDTRGKATVMVYDHPSDVAMCRFCWLEGWLEDAA